jgi:hypothetical protein
MSLCLLNYYALLLHHYCITIASLLHYYCAGYGDFYPSSQTGRLLYAFYIPLSVIWILIIITKITILLAQLKVSKSRTQVGRSN